MSPKLGTPPGKAASVDGLDTSSVARPAVASTTPRTLTVLECHEGILTKRFEADGTKRDFAAGALFKIHELPVSTWEELIAALTLLVGIPQMCIVRGEAVPECPRADCTEFDPWVYRRLHDRPGEPASFRSVPRHWVVYDFDDTATPFNVYAPESSVLTWHATLPAELRFARSAFFLSSSAHASPCVRGKLVTWYARPVSEARARSLALHYGADPSVAGAVQPNYFAAPIFEGLADPLADYRGPILFDGHDAKMPPRAALKTTRERPSPVRLETLPPGDRGIVAALGAQEALVGTRFTLCGKLGGLMRKLGYPREACEAVIREWLPTGDPRVDVDRGVQWALGAWDREPAIVSGKGGLAELVGKDHARVIWEACLRARPAPRFAFAKGVRP